MECSELSNVSHSNNNYEEIRERMDLITKYIEIKFSSVDDGSVLIDSNTVHDYHIQKNTKKIELKK